MGASLLVIEKDWKLLLEEAEQLTDPKHERGAADDDGPVGESEGSHVEEFSADAHNQNLTEQNDEGDEEESAASLEVEG